MQPYQPNLWKKKQITNYESFISIFNKSLNDTCMLKSVKLSWRNILRNPWITSGIINSITHRDNLNEKWKKSPDPRIIQKLL